MLAIHIVLCFIVTFIVHADDHENINCGGLKATQRVCNIRGRYSTLRGANRVTHGLRTTLRV
jgi:hypothetical protein